MWVIVLFKKIFAFVLTLLFTYPNITYCSTYSSSSVCVIDKTTCQTLYENNIYEHRSVASTTKIMTCFIAVQSGKLNDEVTVTDEMLAGVEGSSLYLKANDKISLYDLCVGMMLVSGNDCANAVAYYLFGSISEFANIMNNTAKKLGMKNTMFVTPSGLDDGNPYSCAYDMAILTAVALDNNTFAKIVSMKSADVKINDEVKTVYNHNKLLNYSFDDGKFVGVKTGFTEKAGRCLVSAREYNGNTIICVTLNCPDDWDAHIYFDDICKKKYNRFCIKNQINIDTVGSGKNYVKCSYQKEYYLLDNVKIKEYYYPFVYLPVKKGDKLGTAVVYYNEKIIERLPIEADEDIKNYGKQQFSTTSKIYG